MANSLWALASLRVPNCSKLLEAISGSVEDGDWSILKRVEAGDSSDSDRQSRHRLAWSSGAAITYSEPAGMLFRPEEVSQMLWALSTLALLPPTRTRKSWALDPQLGLSCEDTTCATPSEACMARLALAAAASVRDMAPEAVAMAAWSCGRRRKAEIECRGWSERASSFFKDDEEEGPASSFLEENDDLNHEEAETDAPQSMVIPREAAEKLLVAALRQMLIVGPADMGTGSVSSVGGNVQHDLLFHLPPESLLASPADPPCCILARGRPWCQFDSRRE